MRAGGARGLPERGLTDSDAVESQGLPELSVGIDVSPVVQTTAGTARHVESLTRALEEEGGVTLRRYSFGGAGRAAAAARDVGWYLAGLPRPGPRGGVGAVPRPSPDLPVLRPPRVFTGGSRTNSRRTLGRVAQSADAIIAVSEFTRGEVVE